jgi:hypothetical protein
MVRKTIKRAKKKSSLIKEVVSNPAVQYLAAGVVISALTQVSARLSKRYPQISNFIKENLDKVEDKLGQFNNTDSGSNADRVH